MHEENKSKNRAAIALALCFCVMALTSFLAVKASLNKISESGTAAADNSTSVTNEKQAAAETPVIDSQDNSDTSTPDTSPSQDSDSDYIIPVNGSIQLKYAMTSLVYSQTLDQYMTHPGVDIAAELSSEVKAVADGTVSKVYNDDRYGVTVQISHDNNIVSVYSNLAEQGLAEIGDDVKQGQTIGRIGDTALFESIDPSHLHFEMLKGSNCVDPGEFIPDLKTD